jgi:2'-hydroxyisoflavone reductase
MAEHRCNGVFNVAGSRASLTMATLLDTCREVTGSDAYCTWVSERFLLDEGVMPWTEMPLWIPEEEGPQMRGLMAVDCNKALRTGLRYRSPRETVRDVWEWYRHEARPLRAGLSADREQQLLQRWHAAEQCMLKQ